MATPSLPPRPHLDQLRRQAKELASAAMRGDAGALTRLDRVRRPGTPITLSLAQLAIAREYGFPSWPQLKAEVELRTATLVQRVEAFLLASVRGHFDSAADTRNARAARLLRDDPAIGAYDIRTAAALGDSDRVRATLAGDRELAARPDPRSGWPPLLFACNSRWHQIDPARSPGIVEVATLLLDAGASPDTAVGAASPGGPCSALYAAAGLANHRALARLLLDRGADPDTPAALYHTAFHRDHESLRLLLDRGARAEGPATLGAAITVDDAQAVRLLLAAGIDPRDPVPAGAMGESYEGKPPVPPLSAAIEFDCGTDLIEALLEGGADPAATPAGGRSPFRDARRRGRADIAAMLAAYGATDDASDIDALLEACARADRASAKEMLRSRPDLLTQLTEDDHAVLVDAADHGRLDAVRLMLDIGFPPDARGGVDGATALHAAAGAGDVEVVRLLIAHGADIDARDTTWQSTPLVWASVGSGFRMGHAPNPDWAEVIHVLVAAGASLDGAVVTGKPPSDEVVEVLAAFGVRPPKSTPLT